MINSETRMQIRRYFYAEHWKIGTIARALNVHPDAVRNANGTASQEIGSKRKRCKEGSCMGRIMIGGLMPLLKNEKAFIERRA